MRLHHRLWRRLLVLRRLLGWWLELLLLRLLVLLRRLLGWRLVLLRWLLVLLRRLLVLLRRLLGWRLVLLHWLRRRWRLVLLPGGDGGWYRACCGGAYAWAAAATPEFSCHPARARAPQPHARAQRCDAECLPIPKLVCGFYGCLRARAGAWR